MGKNKTEQSAESNEMDIQTEVELKMEMIFQNAERLIYANRFSFYFQLCKWPMLDKLQLIFDKPSKTE